MEDETAVLAVDRRDRALIQELVYGVTRQKRLLDKLLEPMVSRPPDGALPSILRLGIYQVLFLTRIPVYAVLDEMVQITKRKAGAAQGRFVNAVLRRIVRERDALLAQIDELKLSQPAVGFSVPDWLYERWQARLSSQELLALLNWQNQPADVYARLQRTQCEPEQLARRAEDVLGLLELVELPWDTSACFFRVKAAGKFTRSPAFADGFFYLQDPSTVLSVDLLAPRKGERVLDLCAAPGGKTVYMADCMGDKGKIVACDVASARLAMVTKNCQRIGLQMVETVTVQDGEALPFEGAFDRVLVDVPCSNTGVLRRRADLRWRLKETDLAGLTVQQAKLIRRAAEAVRPGGRLVYSTCSLEPEENGELVRAFLAEVSDFSLVVEKQISPHSDRFDGAYVAALDRRI